MKSLADVGCGHRCSLLTARRETWRPGPWNREPDRVDFQHAGLACLLHRNTFGAWCGYVGVPPGHPWHGKSYDDVDVRVHGGLTYANGCAEHLCHVPAPGEPDALHWFGFDCNHAFDYAPGLGLEGIRRDGQVYRDVNWVRRETEQLAEQLAERA